MNAPGLKSINSCSAIGLATTAAIIIVGCGDSAGSNTLSTAPGLPQNAPVALQVTGDDEVNVGESVGLTVRASDGQPLKKVSWHFGAFQNAVLAPHSQAIGFDASSPGEIMWQVSATLASEQTLTASGSLKVNKGPSARISARLTQEAVELGSVSLRADIPGDDTPQTITWSQVQGPTVETRVSANPVAQEIYFQAPAVDTDTLIAFDVTASFADGSEASDTVWVLVTDTPGNATAYFPSNDLYPTALAHPYRSDSPWADVLVACSYTSQLANSCAFEKLPLLGQQTLTPTIDDVLERTVVSHDWMGDAFAEFLQQSAATDDLLHLMRATTAVVIAHDIRPSFYWSATGAIYLDAAALWRSPAERDTVNSRPDARAVYDEGLSYRTTWRLVDHNEYYYPLPGFSRSQRISREPSQVAAALNYLLYHELAHANDMFPPSKWTGYQLGDSPLSIANTQAPLSQTLQSLYPLADENLQSLAQVAYGGADATEEQRQHNAQDVAYWFEQDGAVSPYSYFSPQEDFAMLFQSFMLLHRLSVDTDIGFFTQETIQNEEYLITWGQRNRVNEQHIQPRAAYVVEHLLPHLDIVATQTNAQAPQKLPAGQPWQETLILDPMVSSTRAPLAKPQRYRLPMYRLERHLPLPKQ